MRSKTTARPLALAKSFDLILVPTNFPLSPKNPEKSGETGRTGRTGQTGQTGQTGRTGRTGQTGETGRTGRTGRRQQPPAATAKSFDLILVPTNFPLSPKMSNFSNHGGLPAQRKMSGEEAINDYA